MTEEGLKMEGSVEKEALIAELRNLLLESYKKDEAEHSMVNYEMVLRKDKELKDKYPDYYTYRLYHLLIGSSVEPIISNPENNSPLPTENFDFPGDDSIEKFIREL